MAIKFLGNKVTNILVDEYLDWKREVAEKRYHNEKFDREEYKIKTEYYRELHRAATGRVKISDEQKRMADAIAEFWGNDEELRN
jgi:hypothetical protein